MPVIQSAASPTTKAGVLGGWAFCLKTTQVYQANVYAEAGSASIEFSMDFLQALVPFKAFV